MKLQLIYEPQNLKHPINVSDKVLSIGSCFAENIAEKLKQFKFDVLLNPNGIVFNPSTIFKQLTGYLGNENLTQESMVMNDGLWHSMNHHGSFSGSDKYKVVENINQSTQLANEYLKNANYLLITFGSAWAYVFKETNQIVSNNHKLDAKLFEKKLLNPAELKEQFDSFYTQLKLVNPNIKILFTVSPVRYIREGLYENNVSKAVLHQLVYAITKQNETDCFYFPAYEIVIDELRDYRFYKQDLVHPNELAINYVWQKFITHCISNESKTFITDYEKYLLLHNHKPLHTDSLSYKKFEEQLLNLQHNLMEKYPFLKLEKNA